MRLITTAATATAVAAGALLIGIPVSAANASTPAPGTTCATQAGYNMVQNGQTVAQVEQEMGSVGAGAVTAGHGPGTTALEMTWQDCSVAGLPVKGALEFGVEFQADAGQPLTVVGKTELPPTTVPGLTSVRISNS